MKIIYVMLSGKQGSGKTTLSNYLSDEIIGSTKGLCSVQLNFAEPLYEMHNACLGVLSRAGIRRDIKKDGPLLQLLGTEWGRKTIDENIWVKVLRGRAEKVANDVEHLFETLVVLVGDCRFKNEIDAFPDAIKVRLHCPKEVRMKRCEMWRENDTHPSEVDLDDYKGFDADLETETTPTHIHAELLMDMILSKARED